MDKVERAQIRLLMEHLVAERRVKAALLNRAMHADHAAKHTLRSGATVRAAVGIAEELAMAFVKDTVAAVADVARDVEAFNMIETEVTIMFQDLQTGIDQAVKLSMASDVAGTRTAPVQAEANRLLRELQAKTLRVLQISRFSFIHTSPNDRTQLFPALQPMALAQTPKNKGGKPLATHWDQMWASIAVQLWNGELEPKSQADISRAMLNWFAIEGVEVGETVVRARARALWLKYEAALLAK